MGDWSTVSRQLALLARQVQFPLLVAMALATSVLAVTGRSRIVRSPGAAPESAATEAMPGARWLAGAITLMGIAAAIVSLLPQQTFTQYFMVPLLLFVMATPASWTRLIHGRSPIIGRTAAIVALALYAGLLARSGSREEKTPEGRRFWTINRSSEEDFARKRWDRASVQQMAAALREATSPTDLVFSTWQGYTFLADRRDIPGNENFNSRTVTNQPPETLVSPDEMRRLRIAPNEQLHQMLTNAEPKAIIIGFFANPYYMRELGVRTPIGYELDQRTGWYRLRPDITRNYRLVKTIGRGDGAHQLWVR